MTCQVFFIHSSVLSYKEDMFVFPFVFGTIPLRLANSSSSIIMAFYTLKHALMYGFIKAKIEELFHTNDTHLRQC